MIAYCARDVATGATLRSADDTEMPSFSTIKILIALAFWRAVEQGALREATPFAFQPWGAVGGAGVLRGFRHAAKLALADFVHLSLAVSDNDATNIVISAVGMDAVNGLADELGLRHTRLRRRMMDFAAAAAGRDNSTSAADLVTLLSELACGEKLSEAVTRPVLTAIELQEHRDGLPRYLPARVEYAGKPGDDLPEGRFCHDCGLLTDGGRRIALAVLTEDAGGYETVARLGLALYSTLSRG